MTLQQLKYITALDNHRHFVKAAEESFVTQPTLTMQVKKLEDEIGVKIFDRSKKPLTPTKAGEEIIAKARQILREVEQLKEFVTTEKETLKGEFRLGIIPTLAPYLLPLFLKTFINKNPDTKLIIKEMQTEEIIDALKKGLIDIGLLVTPLREPQIREVVLFNEPFLLFHPKNDKRFKGKTKVNEDQLDPGEMLILDEGHCFRNQVLNICKKTHPHHDAHYDYESGSIETLKELVKRGSGYTIVPELSVRPGKEEEHIKRFSNPQPIREVSLAVHNSFTKEKLIDELRKAVFKTIPPDFKKKEKHIRVKWR